jgi:hypothetical protein
VHASGWKLQSGKPPVAFLTMDYRYRRVRADSLFLANSLQVPHQKDPSLLCRSVEALARSKRNGPSELFPQEFKLCEVVRSRPACQTITGVLFLLISIQSQKPRKLFGNHGHAFLQETLSMTVSVPKRPATIVSCIPYSSVSVAISVQTNVIVASHCCHQKFQLPQITE